MRPANNQNTPHELVEWTRGFQRLLDGRGFLVCVDRGYERGDEIWCKEYDPVSGELTGASALFEVHSIARRTDDGGALEGLLPQNTVVLGVRLLDLLAGRHPPKIAAPVAAEVSAGRHQVGNA